MDTGNRNRIGRVLNIPSAKDGWELRMDPLPELREGDRVHVDWEAMTYTVVTDQPPPVPDDRIAHWQTLRQKGELSERELRMLEEIERLKGLPWGGGVPDSGGTPIPPRG